MVRLRLTGLAAAVLAVGGTIAWTRPHATPAGVSHAAPPHTTSSASPAAAAAAPARPTPVAADTVDIDWAAPQLRRLDRLAVAGTRAPCSVAPLASGIRCPDGSCLPLLNGVVSAPAIIREPERGPLPPVVALLVDADGFEWYEHADRSLTTSRPQRVIDQHGVESVQTVTLHVTHNGADAHVAPGPTSLPPIDR